MNSPGQSSKPERRAARERVGAYHEAELAKLLAHVRASFDAYEAGTIDAFDLDGVIHHYHRAAQKLYTFCAGSGSRVEVASNAGMARIRRQRARLVGGGSL